MHDALIKFALVELARHDRATAINIGKRATSYPGFEGELTGANVVTERVVQDGNIITSQGPGTAMEFALKLVGDLENTELAEKLRGEMLV